MDADGKNKRLVKNARGLHPTWSPDGKRIAFIAGKNPGDDAQIYVMDVDGRNRKRLTRDFVHKRLPSWSPDGKRIAYVGDNVIWVVDSDGDNPRQLTGACYGRNTPHGHRTVNPSRFTLLEGILDLLGFTRWM